MSYKIADVLLNTVPLHPRDTRLTADIATQPRLVGPGFVRAHLAKRVRHPDFHRNDTIRVPGVWLQAHHVENGYCEQSFRDGLTGEHELQDQRGHAIDDQRTAR